MYFSPAFPFPCSLWPWSFKADLILNKTDQFMLLNLQLNSMTCVVQKLWYLPSCIRYILFKHYHLSPMWACVPKATEALKWKSRGIFASVYPNEHYNISNYLIDLIILEHLHRNSGCCPHISVENSNWIAKLKCQSILPTTSINIFIAPGACVLCKRL